MIGARVRSFGAISRRGRCRATGMKLDQLGSTDAARAYPPREALLKPSRKRLAMIHFRAPLSRLLVVGSAILLSGCGVDLGSVFGGNGQGAGSEGGGNPEGGSGPGPDC